MDCGNGYRLFGETTRARWKRLKLSYGLGSESKDLPAFVVMISGPFDQPVPSRYYHSGFLPSQHQGVQFLAGRGHVEIARLGGTASRTSR